jgi:hypothetical protein
MRRLPSPQVSSIADTRGHKAGQIVSLLAYPARKTLSARAGQTFVRKAPYGREMAFSRADWLIAAVAALSLLAAMGLLYHG